MYKNVSLSPFYNGKVEYCTTSGFGDIEENASAGFFTQSLFLPAKLVFNHPLSNHLILSHQILRPQLFPNN